MKEEKSEVTNGCQSTKFAAHINVIGACITATHRSGHKHPILAKNLVKLEMVLVDGALHTYDDQSMPDFGHPLINFGTLRIIVSTTMLIEPTCNVAKGICRSLSWKAFEENCDAIMTAVDNVNMFTDWQKPEMTSAWIGQWHHSNDEAALTFPQDFFGAQHVEGDCIHPDGVHHPSICTTAGHGS